MKIFKRNVSRPEKYFLVPLLGSALLGTVLAVAGATYQKVSTVVDEHWRYPPPGKLVNVNGYLMHLNCTGEGGPIVIMDSGMGNSSLIWSLVQPEIAKSARVCSYDRAGLGWSESRHGWLPFGVTRRTSRQMTEELHTLLKNAGVPGPYVLVGHSLGGINMRVYASTYPDEVAGMVLVDSSHEETYARLPKPALSAANEDKIEHQEARSAALFGMARLLKNSDNYKWLPADVRGMYMSVESKTQTFLTLDDEYLSFGESVKQAREAGPMPKDIPLFVLAATEQYNSLSPGVREQTKQAWQGLQEELAGRSRNSVFRLVEGSDHSIHCNGHQGEVIDAILWVLEAARNHSRLSSNSSGNGLYS
jgi:pimeloyl-ACP methyl ester carboxylesterase